MALRPKCSCCCHLPRPFPRDVSLHMLENLENSRLFLHSLCHRMLQYVPVIQISSISSSKLTSHSGNGWLRCPSRSSQQDKQDHALFRLKHVHPGRPGPLHRIDLHDSRKNHQKPQCQQALHTQTYKVHQDLCSGRCAVICCSGWRSWSVCRPKTRLGQMG